ncbi:hypothetical protein Pcinc_035985 [Petrolisthes cinctipes]|uniref:Uncharacterized protein n=1 Tax=Petrolisthes cinctipes TaxID=88211 RepID=A0AAE1BVE6_PETCI|nr:hypothetical protein Pcinc_035985 [Petrolisthes cinctipes]
MWWVHGSAGGFFPSSVRRPHYARKPPPPPYLHKLTHAPHHYFTPTDLTTLTDPPHKMILNGHHRKRLWQVGFALNMIVIRLDSTSQD